MIRIIAITLLIIPGVFAAFGIKLMRDALFMQIYPILFNAGLQFIFGLILFIAGVGFIGGYVVHRDRKKNLVTRPKRRK
jgi:hypothetical protein